MGQEFSTLPTLKQSHGSTKTLRTPKPNGEGTDGLGISAEGGVGRVSLDGARPPFVKMMVVTIICLQSLQHGIDVLQGCEDKRYTMGCVFSNAKCGNTELIHERQTSNKHCCDWSWEELGSVEKLAVGILGTSGSTDGKATRNDVYVRAFQTLHLTELHSSLLSPTSVTE